MKQVIKDVRYYNHFNESPLVQVVKINLDKTDVAGISRYRQAYNCSFFLKQPMLSYVAKGEKYMLVNKKEYLLKAGDLLFIPANSVVFTDIPEPKELFESVNLILSHKILNSFGLTSAGTFNFRSSSFAITQNKTLICRFTQLLNHVAEHNEEHPSCVLFLSDILHRLEELLFESSPINKSSLKYNQQTLSSVVMDHLYCSASLPQMASRSNMSLATFKRQFKKLFGESPKTWFRNIRLQAAYFHLKTNRDPVSEISAFVGFDNFSHFSYAFKKYYNLQPSTLLNRN